MIDQTYGTLYRYQASAKLLSLDMISLISDLREGTALGRAVVTVNIIIIEHAAV